MNPLVWLHFRLAGRTRPNAIIAALYVLAVGAIASIAYRSAPPKDWPQIHAAFLSIVTGLQCLIALFWAPNAVRKAVQNDFQVAMIESHRLSPMSNLRIVLGYLMGAPLRSFFVFTTGIVIGSYFALALARTLTSAVPLGWYSLLAAILCLSFMLASLSLLAALQSSGRVNVIGVVVAVLVVSSLSNAGAMMIVPALPLVGGVLSASTVISLVSASGVPTLKGHEGLIMLAAALQIAFGVIFVKAAADKVRAPERPPFSMLTGLLLMLLWALASVMGTSQIASAPIFMRDEFSYRILVQLTASTSALVFLALFPLCAAARERFVADRSASFGVAPHRLRRMAAWLMPIVLAAITVVTLMMMYNRAAHVTEHSVMLAFSQSAPRLAMMAAVVLSLWTDFSILYVLIATGRRLFYWMATAILLLKFLPLFADMILLASFEAADRPAEFVDLYFSGISPIGTFILSMLPGGRPWLGLIAQALIAAGVTWLAFSARRRVDRTAKTARRELRPIHQAGVPIARAVEPQSPTTDI